MKRIPFPELQDRLQALLLRLGFSPERASLSAKLTAETDRDGVRTHGIARLPRFVEMVRLGRIDVQATPERITSAGALERWEGHLGPGNLAAHTCMQRATELAGQFGVGMVALGGTTHWQRGGTYGWQAAEAGFAALCWTNTIANLPPWGASTPALGNNPLVLAVPHREASGASAPLVLDMAMSQFSYGTLASYRSRGEPLPVAGGFSANGELTTDAAAIEASQRALPIGFWKGSGLAFGLDLLAAMTSGGRATHQITPDALQEIDLSQVFIAVCLSSVEAAETLNAIAEDAIAALHAATPVTPGKPARYPGEGTLRVREESLRMGVAVEDDVWEGFLALETQTL